MIQEDKCEYFSSVTVFGEYCMCESSCPHGDFQKNLDIEYGTMGLGIKCLNNGNTKKTESIESKTKVFPVELLN